MSRTPKSSAPDAAALETAKRFDVQRIRVNKEGYDATGAYWGAGHDVFIATSPDGADEVTVRARNVGEARARVAAELVRKPGEKRAGKREPLGGASPHKSRYEFDWQDPAAGDTVRIRITHSRDYLGLGQDHVEIESIKPKKAALPLTGTGYKSHFLTGLELVNAGGPVVFVRAWLAREACSKEWRTKANARAQGDLFQWAEAKGEVSKRKPATAKRHDGKPSRRQTRDPA